MLARRVIACLDVRDGRVVKGTRFTQLRDVGDPAELAERYEADGADEIVFLDVDASVQGRATLLDAVRRTAERLAIPLTVGGGIGSEEDAARTLRSGADKVCVNTAAVARPGLVTECARRFGAQAVVVSIDARRSESGWTVFTHGGRRETMMDAIAWARRCVELGAGEILLTSIDRDGTRVGYDVALTSAVSGDVSVPVVASGGAGSAAHVTEVLSISGADAALIAGVLHDGVETVRSIKSAMRARGIPTRWSADD
jgi:cyclase